jgi:hypothetical protein
LILELAYKLDFGFFASESESVSPVLDFSESLPSIAFETALRTALPSTIGSFDMAFS